MPWSTLHCDHSWRITMQKLLILSARQTNVQKQTMVGHWMWFVQVLCTYPQWIFEFYLSINGPDQGPASGLINAKIAPTWSLHQMRISPRYLLTRTGSVLLFRTLMASPSVDVPILTRLRKFTLMSAVKNSTAIIRVTRHGVKHTA